MFILIRIDDYGPIECELIDTYNRYEDAHDAMMADYQKEEGDFADDYKSVGDSDAACWTEMDGGTYWHIFYSDND